MSITWNSWRIWDWCMPAEEKRVREKLRKMRVIMSRIKDITKYRKINRSTNKDSVFNLFNFLYFSQKP